MKVYTGSGDRGKTSLFSGERIAKSDHRIEAFGDVDELNAVLGMLTNYLPADVPLLADEILKIQSDLFHIGAWLATGADSAAVDRLESISEEKVRFLESAIDRMADELPQLSSFILPTGHESASWGHLARTVCRRMERRVVRLFETTYEDRLPGALQTLLVYINRLSDYLFILARYCNHATGISETPWTR
jgi:cob(I)alamin adenosyltransferase